MGPRLRILRWLQRLSLFSATTGQLKRGRRCGSALGRKAVREMAMELLVRPPSSYRQERSSLFDADRRPARRRGGVQTNGRRKSRPRQCRAVVRRAAGGQLGMDDVRQRTKMMRMGMEEARPAVVRRYIVSSNLSTASGEHTDYVGLGSRGIIGQLAKTRHGSIIYTAVVLAALCHVSPALR
jgi:hypothetical protein